VLFETRFQNTPNPPINIRQYNANFVLTGQIHAAVTITYSVSLHLHSQISQLDKFQPAEVI